MIYLFPYFRFKLITSLSKDKARENMFELIDTRERNPFYAPTQRKAFKGELDVSYFKVTYSLFTPLYDSILYFRGLNMFSEPFSLSIVLAGQFTGELNNCEIEITARLKWLHFALWIFFLLISLIFTFFPTFELENLKSVAGVYLIGMAYFNLELFFAKRKLEDQFGSALIHKEDWFSEV